MTVKAYLSQALFLDQKIDSKFIQLEYLRSLAEKSISVLSDMPSGSITINDKMANIIAKIVDLETELKTEIETLLDLKKEITQVINSVKDQELSVLLEMRYLANMDWHTIADKLKYELRNTYYLHGKALQQVKIERNL